MRQPLHLLWLLAAVGMIGCSQSPASTDADQQSESTTTTQTESTEQTDMADVELKTAVLAGGCFWCTEAVFEPLEGVTEVVSGYAGGKKETADYRTVSTGTTDHAEVIRITYDPAKISYQKLLEIFFTIAHDPTQLNRQGNDRGRQYRSAVFYANEDEKQIAEAYIKKLEADGVYDDPIVTTLEPLEEFYLAEDYHQDYAALNPFQPYIRAVALPKVDKLKKKHGEMLKDE